MARKNKDLIMIYLMLIKAKKRVYFKKGEFLFKIVKEINDRKKIKTIEDVENFIKKSKQKEINRKESEEEVKNVIDMDEEDIFDIMYTLLNFFKTSYKEINCNNNAFGFIEFIKTIAKSEPSNECIVLGSIHAMKGLEAKNVFIVNYFEMPYEFGMGGEYFIQEKNLKYIAETRTKENLYLCYEDEDKAVDFITDNSSIVDNYSLLEQDEEDIENEEDIEEIKKRK